MTPSPKLSLKASGAFCWTSCTAQPAFVQANADKIPPQDTKYSEEGTLAHATAESLFQDGPIPAGADEAMLRHGANFFGFCRDKRRLFSQEWSELEVELFYMPGRRGFVDWCCINYASPQTLITDIHIADYKYGEGVAVNAKDNLQMAIYARSMVQKQTLLISDDTPIHMHIFQPRVREGEKQSTWVLTWAELVQFTDDRVLGPARTILDGEETKFSPGTKTCQFCPATSFCQARASWLLDDTPLEEIAHHGKLTLPKADTLTLEERANIILKKADIIKWLNGQEEDALKMAVAGTPLPGLKLVQSKGGHRKWSDEEEARKLLIRTLGKKTVVKETILTPSKAAEFEFDFPKKTWKKVEGLIFKPEGGPTLAPADDPRPVWGPRGLDLLEDESPKPVEVEDFC